jgi:hypothetical protein
MRLEMPPATNSGNGLAKTALAGAARQMDYHLFFLLFWLLWLSEG